MIRPETVRLRDDQRWLRVADERWGNPLDPSYSQRYGGRWNSPESFPVLYLNENLDTARTQIHRMLEGQPVEAEDLEGGYVLVVATLPSRQTVANAVSDEGIVALDLPRSYPMDARGERISHSTCQAVGAAVKLAGLRGVRARSAATRDGSGRELAWFPARSSSHALPVGAPIPFQEWWPQDQPGHPYDLE